MFFFQKLRTFFNDCIKMGAFLWFSGWGDVGLSKIRAVALPDDHILLELVNFDTGVIYLDSPT